MPRALAKASFAAYLFAKQFKSSQSKGVITAIDIGSDKIVCLIAKIDEITREKRAIRVIGSGYCQSKGIRNGRIINPKEAEKSIRLALDKAEQNANIEVNNVYICISGNFIKSHVIKGKLEIPDKTINQEHVSNIIALTHEKHKVGDQRIMHIVPSKFFVDGTRNVADPTGLIADNLGVELLRFDMSEYMEKHAVSRLIGAPPGYVGFDQGGQLTDGVDQHPHCVLLLDEIEKAHPDVYNVLLQVMDHGTLTDHNGRSVDFRNVIVIMTSNAGATEQAKAAIGFGRDRREGEDTAAIERTFTPEFRNRLDAVISFNPLPKDTILQVVEKFVLQLEAQLMDRHVAIEMTDEAASWLADKGYDDKMGARPLSRVIQEHIKKPLAEELLFGKLSKGGLVIVSVKNNKIKLDLKGPEKRRISRNKPPLLTAS